MRDNEQTVQWYRDNEVWPGSIGFDPDGMCLKICRTARGIGAVYPSALSAQLATPEEFRVHKVSELRRGMVLYYDDPNDSNPFGHIVTMVGRVKGANPDSLGDILVRTNSVQANRIVVVRGDYFPRFWGDEFKFGATWLNGQRLVDFIEKDDNGTPEAPLSDNPVSLKHAVEDLKKAIDHHRKLKHTRLVKALRRDLKSLQETIERFS